MIAAGDSGPSPVVSKLCRAAAAGSVQSKATVPICHLFDVYSKEYQSIVHVKFSSF